MHAHKKLQSAFTRITIITYDFWNYISLGSLKGSFNQRCGSGSFTNRLRFQSHAKLSLYFCCQN